MAAVMIAGLVGCGGGGGSSGSSNITGRFVDSAVRGLDYNCSSGTNGVTNADGEFTCQKGDDVVFGIGGYSIGSCQATVTVTPYDLKPDDETAALNIAQLLQTLDSDGDPSNGITIDADSAAVKALAHAGVSVSAVDFDSAIVSYIGKHLIDEQTAKQHLDATLNAFEDKSSSSGSSSSSGNDTAQVTGRSIVVIANGMPSYACDTSEASFTEMGYEGYTDYYAFKKAGGTVQRIFYSTKKSCSDFSGVGACTAPDTLLKGNTSCVTIVTFP